MKKLKVSLSALVVILGIGSAFATVTKHDLANRKWGRDPLTGVYTDITGGEKGTDYTCTGTSIVCSEEYPADVDPNNQAGDTHPGTALPMNVESGSFAQ